MAKTWKVVSCKSCENVLSLASSEIFAVERTVDLQGLKSKLTFDRLKSDIALSIAKYLVSHHSLNVGHTLLTSLCVYKLGAMGLGKLTWL